MSSDAPDARPLLSSAEASRMTRRIPSVGIVVSLWKEYSHPPRSTSRVRDSIQQTRGDDGIQVGDRVLSLQSNQGDPAHHRERTLL